jgi:GT2 family glycosyltransferase/glycosyltransferase involved in cell wall biosynthesis
MRILLIVHGYPPLASGGTEIYVRSLAGALAATGDDQVFVLTRDADPCRPELSIRRQVSDGVGLVRINNTFQACVSFEESYRYPGLLRAALAEIDEVRPDVAHIHHLTCLSTGLLEALASRGIPMVMTLNDYWLICHRGQLYDLDGRRCEGPFEEGCGRCLSPGVLAAPAVYRAGRVARSLPIPGAETLARLGRSALEASTPARRTRAATSARLEHMQAAASHVDLFLAPSDTIARMFERFGVRSDRMRRCDQGIDLAPFQSVNRERSPVLRLGFAGGLIPSKAPHLLLEAAARLPHGSVSVDMLGQSGAFHGEESYARGLDPLLSLPFVRRTGAVPHERMPDALAAVDVMVVPSVWIENAPFIIREAFAAGAPVIASNLGGMREMVREGVDGLLFDPGRSDALASEIRRLLEEPGLLQRLRAGIRPPVSIHADAALLRETYAGLAGRGRVRPGASFPKPALTVRTSAVVLNYRTPDQTWLAARSLQTSDQQPDRIFIVDNGSGDGSPAFLRARLPGIAIIETGRNTGYPAGCNAGIRSALESGSEFVLLVNSDVVLRPDATRWLMAAARRHPDAGILGPVLLSREEPDHVASAGLDFSERTGRMRHRAAGGRISQLAPCEVRDVPAVSGCVMLVSSAVFRRVGFLDEDYFFSFEDLDFCLRARRSGFRILLVPDAIAYHEGGRSIGRRSPRRVYFATRNHLRLAQSSLRGAGVTQAARGALIVGMNAAYAVLSPEVPLVSGLAAVARGTRDHLRGRYGPGPLV